MQGEIVRTYGILIVRRMANRRHTILTARDQEILLALDRTPLTAGQLKALSHTFAHPFGSERMVRERLFALGSAGWVCSARYATTSHGAGQNYYRLTRTGYRILYGEGAAAPTKRYFAPISIARQHHSRCLADFVVHTIIGAQRANVQFTDYFRENTLRLSVGDQCLYPDCAFQLVHADGQTFNFLVEIDNHSEQIRSTKDADSWQKKITLCEQLQSEAPQRFRVLVVTTRGGRRLRTILTLAATRAHNPQRSLLVGIPLQAYLTEPDALRGHCFLDHRLKAVSLLPPSQTAPTPKTQMPVTASGLVS
jgi:hypothetical protein